MDLLLVFFVVVFLAMIPASIAHLKGHNFGTFWIYGILLLVIATPHAILLTPNRQQLDRDKARQGYGHCPFCAELVRKKAIKCPHCQSGLVENV